MRKAILGVILAGTLIVSCVPAKQFKQLETDNRNCETERDLLKSQNQKLSVDKTEMLAKIQILENDLSKMASDSMKRSGEYASLKSEHNKLLRRHNELEQAQEAMIKGSAKETSRLLKELQTTQDNLQVREDELRETEKRLETERNEIEHLRYELEKRNSRLVELEEILSNKEKAVTDLKNKVTGALLGYENQGLSVTVKNGKVYVSMEEKLLFRSGSYAVDPNGEAALKKLAGILEQNPDISIMIEGHTDDVPYSPRGGIDDNWDLSVKRSTSIVRILLAGSKIDPRRLMAAGRGEFLPIDPAKTPAARQKNRRTEIILTPRLDELLKILESN